MSDSKVWLRPPWGQGEPKEVDATPDVLVPMMNAVNAASGAVVALVASERVPDFVAGAAVVYEHLTGHQGTFFPVHPATRAEVLRMKWATMLV